MTMTDFCFSPNGISSERRTAPSSPHKTGEVLGDSFVSGDPVDGHYQREVKWREVNVGSLDPR